jgi:DnaJ-class molecular chaperone
MAKITHIVRDTLSGEFVCSLAPGQIAELAAYGITIKPVELCAVCGGSGKDPNSTGSNYQACGSCSGIGEIESHAGGGRHG